MIQFENSSLLLLVFLLIPSLFFFALSAKRLFQNLDFLDSKVLDRKRWLKLKLVIRSLCFSLSWIFFVIALSGPSWGTKAYPVQKAGLAMSFVFDISHSMEAEDVNFHGETGRTFRVQSRLSQAKDWANGFLGKIRGENKSPNVSVVITKGESFLSLPFSQDYHAFYSYVSLLNPYLMTAPGSHLGSGIRTATASFPSNHARFSSIILLSDGDDTQGDLEASISEALSYGINVIIIGFGSVEGEMVRSGGTEDLLSKGGEVHTSLKEENLKNIVSRLQLKYPFHSNAVQYFSANEPLSLEKALLIANPKTVTSDKMLTSYTIKPIKRHRECIFVSLMFFIIGLVITQWNLQRQRNIVSVLTLCFFIPFFYTSCSFPIKDASLLLEGAFYASQDAYDKATFVFIKALERAEQEDTHTLKQYALYNLSHAYMKQNENESAKNRLSQIELDAPKHLLFAKFYNQGIIAYEQGDFLGAFSFFQEALLVEPENRDAKINLELSLRQKTSAKPLGESQISEFSESDEVSDAHNSVFTLIRESEENRWKNNIISNGDADVLDY